MKKETLTREKIKQELLLSLYSDIKKILIHFLIFLLPASAIVYLGFKLISFDFSIFLACLPISCVLIICFAYIIRAVILYRYIYLVKTDNFRIETDECVDKKEIYARWDYYGFKKLISAYNHYYFDKLNYHLFFMVNGDYCIKRNKNYVCSEMYTMEAKGVYRYAEVGDEFYLAVVNKNTILLVYNTKLFDFKEN
ncbi:MAG: hypothetical protein E7560_05620 [Ruminococcaceae bacterium]|nr:hypothetical protein [Oscillospiraceae bacterium]